jgi:hypothetical protein
MEPFPHKAKVNQSNFEKIRFVLEKTSDQNAQRGGFKSPVLPN